jgi:hypothetical protein
MKITNPKHLPSPKRLPPTRSPRFGGRRWVAQAGEIRNRSNGYQHIRLSGGGYQDIRASGLENLSFPFFLMSWFSDILRPDLLVPYMS